MAASCRRRAKDEQAPGPGFDASLVRISEVQLGVGEGGPQKAVVLTPGWGGAEARYPLLIALHGRGESNRGLDAGARGWTHDYYLDRAFCRLRQPPLTAADLFHVVGAPHVDDLNRRIRERPFQGLVVVCPYTPDILGGQSLEAAAPFGEFLVTHLIPKIRAAFPVEQSARSTGIDGVSLGGRVALLAGMGHIESFGAIGTLQAAIREREVEQVADMASASFHRAPGRTALRILTSDRDPFRPALEALARALEVRGVPRELVILEGPHDYVFNQGPGSYEMLLWHDRALRA